MTTESAIAIEACWWALADYRAVLPRARGSMGKQLNILLGQAIGERELHEAACERAWKEVDDDACVAAVAVYVEWCDVVRAMCKALGKPERNGCA
jgi:hypothetical protein